MKGAACVLHVNGQRACGRRRGEAERGVSKSQKSVPVEKREAVPAGDRVFSDRTAHGCES